MDEINRKKCKLIEDQQREENLKIHAHLHEYSYRNQMNKRDHAIRHYLSLTKLLGENHENHPNFDDWTRFRQTYVQQLKDLKQSFDDGEYDPKTSWYKMEVLDGDGFCTFCDMWEYDIDGEIFITVEPDGMVKVSDSEVFDKRIWSYHFLENRKQYKGKNTMTLELGIEEDTIYVFDMDETLVTTDRERDEQTMFFDIDHQEFIPEMMTFFRSVLETGRKTYINTNRHPVLEKEIWAKFLGEEFPNLHVKCRNYCLSTYCIKNVVRNEEKLAWFLSQMILEKSAFLNKLAQEGKIVFIDDFAKDYTLEALSENIRLYDENLIFQGSGLLKTEIVPKSLPII